jgi:hypothetical protein
MVAFSQEYIDNLINSGEYTFHIPPDSITKLNDIMRKLNIKENIGDNNVLNNWREPIYKRTLLISKPFSNKDKIIVNIRRDINKLSNETYDRLSDSIIKEIGNSNADDIESIGEKLLGILVTNNSIYSTLYASLYCKFDNSYPIARDILETFLKEFNETLLTFNYCDPNVSYDGYCDYIKKNDSKRSSIRFISQLTNNGMIPVDYIISLIILIQSEIINGNHISEIGEECTEILYIMLTDCQDIISFTPQWETIHTTISKMSTMKKSNTISNKVIFRHMDIMDALKL